MFIKFISRIVVALLIVVAISSCQREKKLYENRVRGSYSAGKYTYDVVFKPDFENLKKIDTLYTYGTVSVYNTTKRSSKEYITYAICNLKQVDDSLYTFTGVCVDEQIYSRRNKITKPHIGESQEMSVLYSQASHCYKLFIGKCVFKGFPKEDIYVGLQTGLSYNEARIASKSILDKYLSEYIGTVRLYPSKYWGNIIVEWELVILLASAVILLLAILVGDWITLVAVPIILYLSLYTSWMVFLPGLFMIAFVPLAYIRVFPTLITYVFPLCGLALGLYIIFDIYSSSTLWNMILLAIVWLFGLGVMFFYVNVWVYSTFRCEDCGRIQHRLRRNSQYIDSAIDVVVEYVPTSDSGEFCMPSSLKGTARKDDELNCYHCLKK